MMTFSEVVEAIQKLSEEEKEEIKSLIEHYLIEEKREKIYQIYLASKQRRSEGKLTFSSDINELMESLED
jgi:alpha-ketoglutarate-dependent taurine dioxygenase